MPFQSINPATGQLVMELPEDPPERIEQALVAAQQAFEGWRALSFNERAGHLRNVAARLRADAPRLAGLMTTEMGKPIAEAEAEVEKCAWGCDFYADNAERFLADLVTPPPPADSYVAIDPLGIGAGDHALELPVLAGLPLRRARPAWPATSGCSSTPRTCRSAPSPSRQVFRDAGAARGRVPHPADRPRPR